jgi:hypothetical protein
MLFVHPAPRVHDRASAAFWVSVVGRSERPGGLAGGRPDGPNDIPGS